jgi:tRNA nucleotidyltransferase (CCA-adding enzyme)
MSASGTQATIATRLDASLPHLAAIREALGDTAGWVVGGTVRDLILGSQIADVDVVVAGDPVQVARRLPGVAVVHERFGTVTVRGDGFEVDFARARAEDYPAPGALPRVRPGSLEEDLARRDFTANAMAVSLGGDPSLVDPHGGLADTEAGVLRVLHERSLIDDPTRAIRAARYAARLGFRLDPATEAIVRAADLDTVSSERVEGELRKLARETDPAAALSRLAEWRLAHADPEQAAKVAAVAREPRFAGADAPAAFLMAGAVRAGRYRAPAATRAARLAALGAGSPSELTVAAHGAGEAELLVARAMGAKWIDDYVDAWRSVRLEIGGSDLIAAGVPEGPQVGKGLAGALRRKLDGEIAGRDAELAAALEVAGSA